MYEQFTSNAISAMRLAGAEASRLNRKCIDAEEVLVGLYLRNSGVAACVLRILGVDSEKLRHAIAQGLDSRSDAGYSHSSVVTARCKQVVDYAREQSERLEQNYVGTEHLLLGLLQSPDRFMADVLAALGLTSDLVRSEMRKLLEGGASYPVRFAPEIPSLKLRLSSVAKALRRGGE